MLSAILACVMGSVVVESASRGVYAVAGYTGHMDQFETAGVGAWLGDRYVEYTDAWHSTGYPSWGRAVQDSVIAGGESGLVSASGYLGGFDGTMFGGVGSGVGNSIVSVVFDLDAPSQATFLMQSLVGGTASNMTVSLRRGAVDVFRYGWPVLDVDVSWAGELLPGRYTFYAFFSAGGGGAGTSGGVGSYDLELLLPSAQGMTTVAPGIDRRPLDGPGSVPGPGGMVMCGLMACRRMRK